jgi:hypothetical protein
MGNWVKIFFMGGIALLFSVNTLSCVNPFAPTLDTSLSAEMCTDLTDINNVFCTFRNAYSFKDTTLYGSLIGSDFMFSYRDYDRGIDVSWGRADEMRTTYGLFQSVQSLSLIWNNLISSDSGTVRLNIVRGFNLTVTFNPGDVEYLDGYANLTFERLTVRDPWKLTRWYDESNY